MFAIGVSAQEISDQEFGSHEYIDFFYYMILKEDFVLGEINRSKKGWTMEVNTESGLSSFMLKNVSKKIKGKDLKKIIKTSIDYFLTENKKGVTHFDFIVEKRKQKWTINIY